jgi:hypothetical protein
LTAYAEIGPRKATFDQMANSFSHGRKPEELGNLLAAHRAQEPGDADLPFWQAEYHWLRGEYADAAAILNAHKEYATKEQLGSWYAQRLVRSLVRAKRLDEAKRALETLPATVRPPLLPAVLAAVRGDVAETGRLLEEQVKTGYHPDLFYYDEDLGPALRSEAFRALRQKYPEPAQVGQRRDS